MLWQRSLIIAVVYYSAPTLTTAIPEVKIADHNTTKQIVCNSDFNDIRGKSENVQIVEINQDEEKTAKNDRDGTEASVTEENETVITNVPPEITTAEQSTPQSEETAPNCSSEEIYLDPGSKSVEVAIDGDIVTTEYGEVQGYHKHGSTGIISYYDIPYGNYTRLFEAPRYPMRWNRVHTVYEHVNRCPQYEENKVIGNLDCLRLSVFTPRNVTNAKVLFHIHGGQFERGSGDDSIYGPQHLVPKGIILILPNYRLGPLGFLCLRNETAPGNAALKDLTLALDWTRRNIKAFGGDPYDITVSGEGSGGALAMYLALSPISKVYISKVITESGSALSHWALDRRPILTAIRLANNIPTEVKTLYEVFEEVDLSTLIEASKGIELKPCIENRADGFITESPWRILNRYQSNITFMIGISSHAGMHEAVTHTNNSMENLNNDFSSLLPTDLAFGDPEERTKISQEIKEKYFGDVITLEYFANLSLFCTDISFTTPVIRSVRELVDSGMSVYLYEFSFVGDLNREDSGLTSVLNGAAKGDIIGYTFCQDSITPEVDSDEDYMVQLLTDLWVSFMKTGIPSADNIVWEKVNKTKNHEEEWLSIGQVVTSENGLHPERMKLWTEIYDKYYIERNRSFDLKHDGLYFFMVGFVLLDVYLKI